MNDQLKITEDELAARLCEKLWTLKGPLDSPNTITNEAAHILARKMLAALGCDGLTPRQRAADTLYDAGSRMLRIADATDCDEPMTEQFYGRGARVRLNEALGDAQEEMRKALALADGKTEYEDGSAAELVSSAEDDALRLADELSRAIMGRVGKDGTIYGLPGE